MMNHSSRRIIATSPAGWSGLAGAGCVFFSHDLGNQLVSNMVIQGLWVTHDVPTQLYLVAQAQQAQNFWNVASKTTNLLEWCIEKFGVDILFVCMYIGLFMQSSIGGRLHYGAIGKSSTAGKSKHSNGNSEAAVCKSSSKCWVFHRGCCFESWASSGIPCQAVAPAILVRYYRWPENGTPFITR